MTTPGPVVGIDVAKAELVVAVRPGGDQWTVPNNEALYALYESGSEAGRRRTRPGISACQNAVSLVSARGHRSHLVGTTATCSCSRLPITS